MTPTPAYEVGRSRPPVESRFQPGRSGNPRGRPRKPRRDYRGTYGASWLDDVVLDEVYRHVPIEAEGRTCYLTTLQAAVRAIGAAAARGSRLHARLLFELTDRIETRRAAQRTAILKDALDAKAGWAELCALAEQQAQPLPEPPYPHPDTLHIDPRTGLVATDDALWESTASEAEPAEPAQPETDPATTPAPASTPAEVRTDTPTKPDTPTGASSVHYDPFVLSPSTACRAGAQDKLHALHEVEGRRATCFDFAQHERTSCIELSARSAGEAPSTEPDEASPAPPPQKSNATDVPSARTLPPGIAFTTLRTVLAHNRRWYRATTQRLANIEPEPPPPQSPPLPKWAKTWTESARKEWQALMDEADKMR